MKPDFSDAYEDSWVEGVMALSPTHAAYRARRKMARRAWLSWNDSMGEDFQEFMDDYAVIAVVKGDHMDDYTRFLDTSSYHAQLEDEALGRVAA